MTYFKTSKGRAEIAERSHALNVVQRRLLIVVDGKKTLNDLGALVRVDELDAALDYLQREGLIESSDDIAPLQSPAAAGLTAASETQAPRAAISPEEFKKVRTDTSRFVAERLGSAADPICDAIDRCENPAELRKLLRGVEIFIGQRLSAETTQAFARHFGALLL